MKRSYRWSTTIRMDSAFAIADMYSDVFPAKISETLPRSARYDFLGIGLSPPIRNAAPSVT
jgi:hypothetical protein